jgi:tetratricopeptide (TPR) repeat protein
MEPNLGICRLGQLITAVVLCCFSPPLLMAQEDSLSKEKLSFIAGIYLQDNNLEALRKFLPPIKQFSPEDAQLSLALGRLYFAEKKYYGAAKAFGQALRLNKTDEALYWNYISLLYTGDYFPAFEAYRAISNKQAFADLPLPTDYFARLVLVEGGYRKWQVQENISSIAYGAAGFAGVLSQQLGLKGEIIYFGFSPRNSELFTQLGASVSPTIYLGKNWDFTPNLQAHFQRFDAKQSTGNLVSMSETPLGMLPPRKTITTKSIFYLANENVQNNMYYFGGSFGKKINRWYLSVEAGQHWYQINEKNSWTERREQILTQLQVGPTIVSSSTEEKKLADTTFGNNTPVTQWQIGTSITYVLGGPTAYIGLNPRIYWLGGANFTPSLWLDVVLPRPKINISFNYLQKPENLYLNDSRNAFLYNVPSKIRQRYAFTINKKWGNVGSAISYNHEKNELRGKQNALNSLFFTLSYKIK